MKKVLSVILILFVLCTAGLCWAYNNWKESPSYSLSKVGLALQSKDSMMIEKYIDIESLLGDAFDTFFKESLKIYGIENNNDILDMMIGGVVSASKPQIVSALKQGILDGIKNTSESSYEESISKSKIKSLKVIRKDSDLASVEIILLVPEAGNKELKLLLGMKKYSNYWRIERLQNSEDILKLFEEELAKAFSPSVNPEQNIASEMISILKNISGSMQRAMLINGKYHTDLSLLDVHPSNIPFKGNSFKTDYFEVSISGTTQSTGKAVARRIGPKPYTITIYYDSGDLQCSDAGNGMCGQINLYDYY